MLNPVRILDRHRRIRRKWTNCTASPWFFFNSMIAYVDIFYASVWVRVWTSNSFCVYVREIRAFSKNNLPREKVSATINHKNYFPQHFPHRNFLTLRNFFPVTCYALRDVKIHMPTAIQRGNMAIFICSYDLEGDTLYQVKWYKGRREFYRYTPQETPSRKVFAIPGLLVLVSGIHCKIPAARVFFFYFFRGSRWKELIRFQGSCREKYCISSKTTI